MTVRQNIWILHQWDRKLCEKLIRIIKIFHRLLEDCHCVTFMIRKKIHQIFQRKNHQIFQQWDKIFQYFHNRTKLVKSVDYENISTCNIEQLTFDFEHLKEISERFYWKFNDQSSTINIRIQIFREVSTLEGLQTNWLLSWAVKFEAINLIMSSHFTWKKHSRLSSQHQKYSTEINCNLFVGIFIKKFYLHTGSGKNQTSHGGMSKLGHQTWCCLSSSPWWVWRTRPTMGLARSSSAGTTGSIKIMLRGGFTGPSRERVDSTELILCRKINHMILVIGVIVLQTEKTWVKYFAQDQTNLYCHFVALCEIILLSQHHFKIKTLWVFKKLFPLSLNSEFWIKN